MRWAFVLFAVFCASACGDNGGNGCKPAGAWLFTYARGPGDCLAPGEPMESDSVEIEETADGYRARWSGESFDSVEWDAERCYLVFAYAFYWEPTATTAETYGAGALEFEFSGDQVEGANSFEKTGGDVDCNQVLYLSGERL